MSFEQYDAQSVNIILAMAERDATHKYDSHQVLQCEILGFCEGLCKKPTAVLPSACSRS